MAPEEGGRVMRMIDIGMIVSMIGAAIWVVGLAIMIVEGLRL